MERPIEPTNWSTRHKLLCIITYLTLLTCVTYAIAIVGRQSVAAERLCITRVSKGEFREYIIVSGVVQPSSTLYLNVERGGVVQHVYSRAGTPVSNGDPILSLSNTGTPNQNTEAAARRLRSAQDVRAPVDGFLTSLTAEVGQRVLPGQRIGQIDHSQGLKVRASVDQLYSSSVTIPQRGTFNFNGRSYNVQASKIHSEPAANTFAADMTFVDRPPAGILNGQRLDIDLTLRESKIVLMIPKGDFYTHTGGHWIYRLSADRRYAHRAAVVFGKQNPAFIEVISGLSDGDYVITAGYNALKGADELLIQYPHPHSLME